MAGCVTGKRQFATREMAEEVLIDSWVRYTYARGHGPVAVYRCDDCGEYHLTSSGEMNPALAKFLKEGNVQRQKEALYWADKLKRKGR
jgi:hypothetical protein